ncbi:MAG: DNA-binding transcriptional regulator Fis [Gammaproteobacteria bacterium]|nr:DNA-binding transcriptional regulator Fis [Gammaproteobacteria bacterium]MDH3608382.1 DNA-binding transcriptional regulator Fis [Gammaproteobacteria bacterium]NNC68161.1 DNA-binding transcriptional regulator Fis [Gammaproteobacteria bacterium]
MNASFSTAQVTTLHQERRKQPLRDNVKNSLRLYLNSLSGHEPEELYKMFVEEVERPLLESVMEYCNGNQTKAARYLGLNRGTLRKKLKLYSLN